MSQPATHVFSNPLQADSLIRADALEREITDLCAQINAARCTKTGSVSSVSQAVHYGSHGLTVASLPSIRGCPKRAP